VSVSGGDHASTATTVTEDAISVPCAHQHMSLTGIYIGMTWEVPSPHDTELELEYLASATVSGVCDGHMPKVKYDHSRWCHFPILASNSTLCVPAADDYSWKPACRISDPRGPADTDVLVMAVCQCAKAAENRGMF
jgi:hypothetical protein